MYFFLDLLTAWNVLIKNQFEDILNCISWTIYK